MLKRYALEWSSCVFSVGKSADSYCSVGLYQIQKCPCYKINVILGKTATQKATYVGSSAFTFEAGKAVDGIYIPDNPHSSAAAIAETTDPWWRVDLAQPHCIWAVRLLNRPGMLDTHSLA